MSDGMRELVYFVASAAVAALIASLQVLLPLSDVWRAVLWGAAGVLGLSAAWLLIDFISGAGMGSWIGLNQPMWVRGLIGAVVGATVWIAATTHHSVAEPASANPPNLPNVTSAPTTDGVEHPPTKPHSSFISNAPGSTIEGNTFRNNTVVGVDKFIDNQGNMRGNDFSGNRLSPGAPAAPSR
jgi:parallel beta-helix repeat protein